MDSPTAQMGYIGFCACINTKQKPPCVSQDGLCFEEKMYEKCNPQLLTSETNRFALVLVTLEENYLFAAAHSSN